MLLMCALINLINLINFWFAIARADQENENRPILLEIALPKKLVENQPIRLNCDLLQGARPIQFSWYFDDVPIKQNERLQIETRADSSSLMIKRLSVDQIGSYRCVSTNEHGSDQQTVAVYANSKWLRVFVQIDSVELVSHQPD